MDRAASCRAICRRSHYCDIVGLALPFRFVSLNFLLSLLLTKCAQSVFELLLKNVIVFFSVRACSFVLSLGVDDSLELNAINLCLIY